MDFSPANLSPFHTDVLQHTYLGQICGTQQLFRHRYQILRMLGRGGFGVTFLAQDVYLPGEPLCVIKQLCPKFTEPAAIQSARERFEREAKTLSLLGSHSQIPRLLDYFVEAEDFYLVQEYVRGHTLARIVRKTGPISELGARRFLGEMLSLLAYVHGNRVVHRDIKPQNIIRCQDDGRLVLIDFGAVKEIAQFSETGSKTATTNFIGTVGFAPPEQFSLRPTYASDIYALGVTCIYLLAGKAPLDLPSRRNGEIDWRQAVPGISESLGRVIDKMVQFSLAERYQSVQAILRDLTRDGSQADLANCLTVQSPAAINYQKSSNSEENNYRAPNNRTAIAIRDWKARLQQRQQRLKQQRRFEMLHNSTSSF